MSKTKYNTRHFKLKKYRLELTACNSELYQLRSKRTDTKFFGFTFIEGNAADINF